VYLFGKRNSLLHSLQQGEKGEKEKNYIPSSLSKKGKIKEKIKKYTPPSNPMSRNRYTDPHDPHKGATRTRTRTRTQART